MSKLTPYPSPFFSRQCENALSQSFGACYSGELTVLVKNAPIGVTKTAGKVKNVFLSVQACGKDDSNPLQISGEVYINSTSCLTTKPSITYVSGEDSQQKTTAVAGDTGIAQAVIDQDNCTYNPGDVLTYDFTLVRTASPTTEVKTPCIVVELEPAAP